MREECPGSKAALRQELLAARRRIPPTVRRQWSAAICAEVCGSSAFERAVHLVTYAPMGAEVDPSEAAVTALRTGRRLYYPATAGAWALHESRRIGGELDGVPSDPEVLALAADRVLFLVPGVAFDRRGNRLGRGYGWYDRILSRFDRAHRMGLAFDLQLVPAVPCEAWDVPMHTVATPGCLLRPGRSFEPSEGTPKC